MFKKLDVLNIQRTFRNNVFTTFLEHKFVSWVAANVPLVIWETQEYDCVNGNFRCCTVRDLPL